MSPDTPLFGRMTLNSNRIDLGRAGISILMIRTMEQLRKLRPSDDTVIQLEFSRNKLPEATTFNKTALLEQSINESIADPSTPSPFPNLTIGDVTQIMQMPEFDRYSFICEPANRIGMSQPDIDSICLEYAIAAPDAIGHFPKWIES